MSIRNLSIVKKIKRIIALLLAVSMIIGSTPTTLNVYADTTTSDRYSVLILDTSGSLDGVPLSAMKKAAIKFCASLSQAPGNNYVAIISLNSSSVIKQEFTADFLALESTINNLHSGGGTNITSALEAAQMLLSGISDSSPNIKKMLSYVRMDFLKTE